MNQLTVRGFDDELSASLRRLAKSEGISLNKAALKLMRKGAGLTGSKGNPNVVGQFAGRSVRQMEPGGGREFRYPALEFFETVDESKWT